MLRAGLDVVTTMNVAHLRSVRDYAARITGVGNVACVPDEFVRAGEVDTGRPASGSACADGSPRARCTRPEQVGGALAEYFRAANLRALSELGRAWMAGTVDAVGEDLLARRGLAQPSAPPVIVVGDSGSSWGELVIRRATELARAEDAQLLVVHVQVATAWRTRQPVDLDRHRELTADLGGNLHRDRRGTPRRRRSPGRPSQGRSHRGGRAPPVPPGRARPRFGVVTAAPAPARRGSRRGTQNPDRCQASLSPGSGIPYGMKRGQLRIYLGAAPGVGKTYAMLGEGQRRARGTDVVVGFARTTAGG